MIRTYRRSTAVLSGLALLCATFWAISALSGDDTALSLLALESWPSGWKQNRDDGNYCTTQNLYGGKWKRREPPLRTMDEFSRHYGFSARVDENDRTCRPTPLLPDIEDRTLRVGNWEWQTVEDCQPRKWDPIKFAIRFLRAPNGLILVGDSLVLSAFDTLHFHTDYDDSPFRHEHDGMIRGRIYLRSDHALTQSIIDQAGVPRSRLISPIASFYRHHHLLSKAEFAEVFAGQSDFRLTDEPNEPDWMPLFLEDKALRGISQQFAYPPKLTEFLVPNEKSAQKEERDVLVLQTGAHWTVDEFGGKISREQIKGGYQKMVRFVLARLEQLAPHVTVVWRSTSPGHPQCDQYVTAEPERTDITSTQDPERAIDYNWVILPHYNEIIVDAIHANPHLSVKRPGVQSGTSVIYQDVYRMSLQRPEAHPGNNDCLHFCKGGVMTTWHEMLWHDIVQDSLHAQDY